MFPLQRAKVGPLVGELRSYMPCALAKKKKKRKKYLKKNKSKSKIGESLLAVEARTETKD